MKYYVYILKCKDNSFYTGITANLSKRLFEHRNGLVPFTKNRRPIKLVYEKCFLTRKEAAKHEKEIKGWRREKKRLFIEKFTLSKPKVCEVRV